MKFPFNKGECRIRSVIKAARHNSWTKSAKKYVIETDSSICMQISRQYTDSV